MLHPITDIIVAGQNSDAIRTFCNGHNIRFINEEDVLPPKVALHTRGWVRQQVLKLYAFDFIGADNILAYDADTYLVRDLAFFVGERQILFLSDEYTTKYEDLIQFLIHFMLLQRDVMKGLHDRVISNRGMTLSDAILSKMDLANTSLSEFEIYGNYMHSFEPERFVTRYWYNQKLPPIASTASMRFKRAIGI